MTNQEFEELKAELKDIKSNQVGFGGTILAVCIGSLIMGILGAIIGKSYVNNQFNKLKGSEGEISVDKSGIRQLRPK